MSENGVYMKIVAFCRFLRFLWVCSMAYRSSDTGVTYLSVIRHGVPSLTVLIARDRDAWQLSNFAAEYRFFT